VIAYRKFIVVKSAVLILVMLLGELASAATATEFSEIRRLIAQAKYEEAAARLEKIFAAEPRNARAETLLGIVRAKQNRLDQAEVLFVKAIEHAPKSEQAYRELATLYADHGNSQGAIDVYEKLVFEVKESVTARAGLAKLYEKQGEFAKSLEHAEHIAVTQRPWDLLPVMLLDYLSVNNPDGAQKTVGEILNRLPGNAELAPRTVDVFLGKGMTNDAAEFLKVATARQRPSASLLAAVAKVQDRQGQREEAWATINRALSLNPRSTIALLEGARQAGLRNDWDPARKFLERANKLDANNPEILKNLVFALLKLQKVEDAYPYAVGLRRLKPHELEATMVQVTVLMAAKRWGVSKTILDDAVKRFPEDLKVQLALGIVEYQLGEIDRSAKLLGDVLAKEPKNSEAHFHLGLIEKQRGNMTEAITEFEQTLKEVPNHLQALEALGPLYLQTGELEKARAVLERASEMAPDNSGTHYQLSMIYTRLGMPDKAKQHTAEYQRLSKH